MSPVLYPGRSTLLLVMKPIAEGVGVTGGGLVGVFTTFLRLLGVSGGGGIDGAPATASAPSCATASLLMSSVVLIFRPRFFDDGATASATCPFGSSATAIGFV